MDRWSVGRVATGAGRGHRGWAPAIIAALVVVAVQTSLHQGLDEARPGAGESGASVPAPDIAPSAEAGSGARFLSGDADPSTAARWSRCSAIRWAIDPMNIDASGVDERAELQRWTSVVESLAAATGYRFTRVPVQRGSAGHRPGVLPAIAGIDIVVTYESADDPGGYRRPTLAKSRRVAESWLSWVEAGTGAKLATNGSVIMDYRDLATATASGEYAPDDRVALMAHEFGHVMGLAHDDDEQAAMFDEWLAGKGGLTAGDIAGLNELAGEPCANAGPGG